MNEREPFLHYGFWLLALLWLPAAVAADGGGAVCGRAAGGRRSGGRPAVPGARGILRPASGAGVPRGSGGSAIGAGPGRRERGWAPRRPRQRCLPACSGPLAIAVAAVLLSLPAWIAGLLLGRRG